MQIKKQKNDERIEDTRYSGVIPEEVFREMPEEIIDQYFLWDEVFKREIELHPELVLPLIEEVFHKSYPAGIRIRLLATEYVVRRIHKGEGATLNSVYADLAVQIEKRDIYHMECQMKKDQGMVLRMLEYDFHIGLTYSTVPGGMESGMEMMLPRSVIIYLNDRDNMASEEKCIIQFADGNVMEYRVPVMKVQKYSLSMIEQKALFMLVPFLPIRFKKYLGGKTDEPEVKQVRKELTGFIRECMIMVERAKGNGTLTQLTGEDIMEFLSLTCDSLLKKEPELGKEVHEIMNPTIKLPREIAAEKVKEAMEKADEERKQAYEEVRRMNEELEKADEERKQAYEELRRVSEEQKQADEEKESSIRKLVCRFRQSGQSFQEIKEALQDIFSLSEEKAEEKCKRYWSE